MNFENIKNRTEKRIDYFEKRKHREVDKEDNYNKFLYAEWRSYLYKYILLISAIVGFSVTLLSTQSLVQQIDKQMLYNAYLFFGVSVVIGFISIGYSIYKERRILLGRMMWTIAGEYLLDEEFAKLLKKTKADKRAKKLYDELNSSVTEYPLLFGIFSVVTFTASFIGFYFLIKSFIV